MRRLPIASATRPKALSNGPTFTQIYFSGADRTVAIGINERGEIEGWRQQAVYSTAFC